jgi:hypothetical protein
MRLLKRDKSSKCLFKSRVVVISLDRIIVLVAIAIVVSFGKKAFKKLKYQIRQS